MIALTSMLKVVGRLENLRRAPGAQGQLSKIPKSNGFHVYLKEDRGGYSVFPMSMYSPFLPSILILHPEIQYLLVSVQILTYPFSQI